MIFAAFPSVARCFCRVGVIIGVRSPTTLASAWRILVRESGMPLLNAVPIRRFPRNARFSRISVSRGSTDLFRCIPVRRTFGLSRGPRRAGAGRPRSRKCSHGPRGTHSRAGRDSSAYRSSSALSSSALPVLGRRALPPSRLPSGSGGPASGPSEAPRPDVREDAVEPCPHIVQATQTSLLAGARGPPQ